MTQDLCCYEYDLDDNFFKNIDAPEIRKGKLHVRLDVKKFTGGFILNFHTFGQVVVPCDRCLDDMSLAVDTTNMLKVKLGTDYSDNEEVVTVSEEEGYIDITWFLYEFIALSLPMQHTHEDGECNPEMMKVLNQHLCVEEEGEDMQSMGEEQKDVDPRWNDLRKLIDNN